MGSPCLCFHALFHQHTLVSFLEGYAGRAVLLGQFARAVNVGIENRVVALVLPAVGNGLFTW